jgi:hypothetical protein
MLSERFTQALTYAHELHATQKRKAGDIPISCIQKMKNENFHPSLFTAYCRLQEVQSYHAFTPSFFFLPPDS